MTDFNEQGQVVAADSLDGARAWCHIMYGLPAISAISGILTSATIVGAFVFWSGLRWSDVTSQPERVCKANSCLGLRGE